MYQSKNKTSLKKIGTALVAILFANILFSQVEFTTNKFQETLTTVKDIDIEKISDLGIKFLIDEKFLKYDKVEVYLTFKQYLDEFTQFPRSYTYYPTSARFEDRHGEDKEIMIYLITDDQSIEPLGEREIYFRIDNYQYTFQIAVKGYFENGTESVWYEKSETVGTQTSYSYSKDLYLSEEFTFSKDEEAVEKAENEEKSKKNYLLIANSFLEYKNLPYVGKVQPKKAIFDAYALFREKYIEQGDYTSVFSVEEKLIELKDQKTKNLKKLLKDKTDPEEIMKIILDY